MGSTFSRSNNYKTDIIYKPNIVFDSNKNYTHPVAQSFFYKIAAAGGDVSDKFNINEFVIGMSKLLPANSWVCWPMRSQHNAGNGTVLYSLGNLLNINGILTNGPTWGVNGITFGLPATNHAIFYPIGLLPLTLSTSFSYFGAINQGSQDNFTILSSSNLISTDNYGNLNINQSTNIGVIPVITRNSTQYFQNVAGGAFSTTFSTVSSVFRNVSQANYKNGNLISNESGLNMKNPIGGFQTMRTASGNSGGSTQTVPFAIFMLGEIDQLQLHNLIKNTIGQGLGLP